MSYYIDGYTTLTPYRWRGKNLERRAAASLRRYGADPDLNKFYTNALNALRNKMAESRRRMNNGN